MLERWVVIGETGAPVYSQGWEPPWDRAVWPIAVSFFLKTFFLFDPVFIWVLILEFFSDRDILQSNESKVKLFLLKEDWLLRWERPVTTANNTEKEKKSLQHPDFLISSITCLFFSTLIALHMPSSSKECLIDNAIFKHIEIFSFQSLNTHCLSASVSLSHTQPN